MKGVIVKEFKGNGNWYILGDDGIEYYLGFRQCINKEKYFKEGVSVTFDVKDTGGKRLEAWNCVAEEPPKPIVTNYNRIHHMNAEEMAKWLIKLLDKADANCTLLPCHGKCAGKSCIEGMIDWLQQETT